MGDTGTRVKGKPVPHTRSGFVCRRARTYTRDGASLPAVVGENDRHGLVRLLGFLQTRFVQSNFLLVGEHAVFPVSRYGSRSDNRSLARFRSSQTTAARTSRPPSMRRIIIHETPVQADVLIDDDFIIFIAYSVRDETEPTYTRS